LGICFGYCIYMYVVYRILVFLLEISSYQVYLNILIDRTRNLETILIR
jgi:hypothetical protein